jgi:hypothetical protein
LGIPGSVIGGGVGLLAGLFSEDPSEIARKRWEAFKRSLQEMKQREITEGTKFIGKQTAANVASATAGGRRRAIATGRDYQSESFILPGVGQAETTGARALENFLTDTENKYNAMEMQANLGEVNLPIPEQPSDYFDVIAGGVGQFAGNKNRYDLLEKALMGGANVTKPQFLNNQLTVPQKSSSGWYKW